MIGSIEGWNCRFEPAWFHLEILDRHRGERICARRRSRVYRGEKKDGLDPNTVRVELYADGVNGGEPVRQEMMHEQEPADANGYIYSAQVPSIRPATDYTARVIPQRPSAKVLLEAARILWQR